MNREDCNCHGHEDPIDEINRLLDCFWLESFHRSTTDKNGFDSTINPSTFDGIVIKSNVSIRKVLQLITVSTIPTFP